MSQTKPNFEKMALDLPQVLKWNNKFKTQQKKTPN